MRCPGQDTQYWKPGAIFEARCPRCDHPVEFFKDDPSRRCGQCGHRFANPRLDFGCAAYCQFAEQCLGTLPPEVLAAQENLLKDRVAVEVKRHFRTDFALIGRATRRARHAERIGKDEQANLAVILAAAYLYEIGLPAAQSRYGPEADRYRAAESLPPATALLEKLGAPPALIEGVVALIAPPEEPAGREGVEGAVLADARRVARIEEDRKKGRPVRVEPERFQTAAGLRLAKEVAAGA